MRKSKMMKALLVFGMSVVTATAMVGFAACDNGSTGGGEGGGEQTGHKHVWSAWTPVEGDNTKHQHECTAAGHDGSKIETASHGTADSKGQCPDCHYQLVTGGEEQNEDVVINIASVYTANNGSDSEITLADGVSLGEGLSVYLKEGKSALKCNSSGGKKPLVAGVEVNDATHRLQLTSTSNGGIKVALEEDAQVLVYANSGSTDVRKLALYSELSSNAEKAQEQSIGATGNDLDTAVFEVKGGETYYIGASNTVNIFYIIVSYKTITETPEKVDAKAANCTDGGNIEYYKTNYGRYYVMNNDTKVYKSIQEIHAEDTVKLGHNYTYEVTDIPTESDVGSATLTCGREGCADKTKTVELPVLTNAQYTQDTTGQESGKAKYSITLSGTLIEFVADAKTPQAATWDTVYTNDFEDATQTITFLADNSIAGVTTAGLYGGVNDSAQTGFGTYDVKIENGQLVTVDGGGKTTSAYVHIGDAVTSGIIKVTGKITLTKNNGSWTFLQLLNASNEEFVGLRTPSSGNIGVRIDGGSSVTGTVAFSANTEFSFEILIDFANKTVDVKIGNTAIEQVSLSTKGTGLAAIKIATADSATDRNVKLNEIKVEKQA